MDYIRHINLSSFLIFITKLITPSLLATVRPRFSTWCFNIWKIWPGERI